MITGMRQIARRIRSGLRGGVLILVYHRVTVQEVDPYGLSVTPQHFSEHLEVLGRDYQVLSLPEVVRRLDDGRIPRRAVTITFDDGYADNLYEARPLLTRHGLPATVFIVAEAVWRQQEFWWDELGWLLLRPGNLPAAFRWDGTGRSYEWRLGDMAHYGADDHRRHVGWTLGSAQPAHPRQRFFRSMWQLAKLLSEVERGDLIQQIRRWAGAEPAGRPNHRPLSPEEVSLLERGGLIQVGAHSLTHPILSRLSAAEQQEEIQRGKERLEDILGHEVAMFAYPYGSRADYSAETMKLAQAVGFQAACANFRGLVQRGSDRFQFPRMGMANWGGEDFARRLRGWFWE
jgi:peptidoglycan/xylan/chitin deacetylase (PgdA/CDA1 family)